MTKPPRRLVHSVGASRKPPAILIKDGIRDLVVSNWDVDRITVHLGIGGGFFSAPIVFTEDRPSSLGVADFNQDGSDDFFILLYGTGDIRIMFGDGLGGFTPSGFILGHGGAFGGLVADVNNDNVDDIVVHSRTIQPGSVDGISAFINDGSGSFTRIDSIGGFTYGNLDGRPALAPGDFNGDGNIEILAGGTTSTNGTVFPFFGDGTGNFTVPPRIETFQRPFSVQAGHFNMDGALDFMVQGIAGGSFATMLGDAFGSLLGPVSLGVVGGLFLGKQLGVVGAAWIAVRLGLGQLPAGVNWGQLYGAAALAGIGFTMSLFVASLAFVDPALIASAKLSILAGSFFSAVAGLSIVCVTTRMPQRAST